MRVAVVGGGIGGLAAAGLVARAGHEVTLLEATGALGGKCRRIELDGQRVDTGPSLLTFPAVFDALCRRWDALGGGGSADRIAALALRRLPNLGVHVFEDGEELPLPVPPGHPLYGEWRRFASAHEDLGDTLAAMLWQSPRELATTWPALRLALRYRGRPTAQAYLRSRRLPERLRRAIAIHSLDAGVGPHRALPIFASLPPVLAHDGVFVPRGGMVEVVDALARLARAAGVEIELGAPGAAIEGQRVNGRRFDRVIANLDERRLAALTGDRPPPERPATCSGVAIYATLDALPAGLDRHLVVLPEDDRALYAALEARREPTTGTMAFVHGARARDGRRATLSVLLTAAANGARYDLDHPFVARELGRVERLLGVPALRDRFRAHAVLDPAYFDRHGSPGGALYGDVRGLTRSGPLHDFPHRDPARPWLYRVGAGVHPGGGIPAVLGGAMIAVEQLLAEAPGPRRAAGRPGGAPALVR